MIILVIGVLAYLLFLLQRKVYERLWNRNLYVSVNFSRNVITEGEEGAVVQVIENRKRLPLTMLKVKFQTARNLAFADTPGSVTSDQYYRNEIFQIGGGERITRTLPFTGARRGYCQITNVDLVGTDLFLSSQMIDNAEASTYLYVYPKCYDSREFRVSLQNLNGEILVRRHLLEDPFEYRGIREYQPFDDMRSVNWKATAKSGSLMVNQRNYTAMQTVRVFLNVEDTGIWKKTEEVEASMQIVMGLSAFFLAQGIKVACYSNGRDILTNETLMIGGGAGAGQQDVIAKGLARIALEKQPESFVGLFEDMVLENDKNTINVFVAPNAYEDFCGLLDRCREHGISYTWFYPYSFGEQPPVPDSIRNSVQYVKLRK